MTQRDGNMDAKHVTKDEYLATVALQPFGPNSQQAFLVHTFLLSKAIRSHLIGRQERPSDPQLGVGFSLFGTPWRIFGTLVLFLVPQHAVRPCSRQFGAVFGTFSGYQSALSIWTKKSPQVNDLRASNWVQGLDLNQRPSGYEGVM